MPANTTELEKRLWSAADELRANPRLKSSEYSVPVLGLIFLRYADHKFAIAKAKLATQATGRRTTAKGAYQAQGVLFLPEAARFSTLLQLPEGADTGRALPRCAASLAGPAHEDFHCGYFESARRSIPPRTYKSLTTRNPICPLELSGCVPVRAAFRYLQQYDA